MRVLVAIDTIIMAVMALLLLGLLRAYAEIIRRAQDRHGEATKVPLETRRARGRQSDTPAFDIVGTTPDGGASVFSATGGQSTLLAFLTSGCLTCQTFWHGLAQAVQQVLPLDARIVVVAKDRDHESPSRLKALNTSRVPMVMSSKAWTDYAVETSPYFIFVDGRAGKVLSEGTAATWDAVLSLLNDSFEDLELNQANSDGLSLERSDA